MNPSTFLMELDFYTNALLHSQFFVLGSVSWYELNPTIHFLNASGLNQWEGKETGNDI